MIRFRGQHIELSRKFAAPSQKLWDLLTDTHQWPKWGPSVSAVRCADRYIRYRSTGKVHTAAGFWVPFMITEFVDGYYWSWHVYGIRATGHRVEYEGLERCNVIFEVPMLAAPYLLVCHLALNRIEKLIAHQEFSTATSSDEL